MPTRPDLAAWLAYFEANAVAPDPIPWEVEETLTPEQSRCIAASVAKFQLGEYSEGHSLYAFARAFAEELGDQQLVAITRYFIKEEQKHANLLKRFMQAHGLPLMRKNWTDSIFRRLRKLAGYELSVTVLITAELIALVYYRALRACTDSRVLAAICDRILEEEDAHTRYESELLRFLRGRRSGWLRGAPELLHRFLYAGTVLVVYFDHRRALRRGGYGVGAFWAGCWEVFARTTAAEAERAGQAA